MKRLLALALSAWLAFGGPVLAQSTVNPNIPAQSAQLASAPVRGNFGAAANDINGILGMHAVASLGACSVQTQTIGADCLVVGSPTAYQWFKYSGANGYVLIGTINPSVSPPTFSSGLAPVPNGQLIANCTGATAIPSGCTWSAFADQAISATNGNLPYRSGGSWGTAATGTAGHTIPFLDGSSIVFTNPITSGVAGSSVGNFCLANVTSGSICVLPSTGALGSSLATLPANTGQIAELNFAQNWSALQQFNNGATVAGLTVTSSLTATGLIGLPSIASQTANTVVGSAATGSPTALSMPSCVGVANALQWTTGTGFNCQAITAAAGSIAVGTTAITSGTIGNVFYHASGNLLGELTTTGTGTVLALAASPTITGESSTGIVSLGIRSTGTGAFDLTIANTENLTAGRTLTVVTNDAARTINLGGNLVIPNNFTVSGGQILTLTTTTATNVTLPASGTGTLATLAGSEALTNKTYNGNTWTAGTGTLTIAAGKTLTYNNSITIGGTDATTMTFPTTSATIARTDAAQTFTGTQTFSGTVAFNSLIVITSANAQALSVGLNGQLNPAFNVDASTGTSATGWNVKSAAAAGGAALSVISSGTNENGTIDSKGSGTLTLNGTATGNIVMGRAVTLNSTINKLTLTAPATGSTLTIADGKTHVVNNSITLAGTDATTWTGASANMTLAALNLTNQVITGGATATAPSAQTTSFTANCGLGPIQFITGPTSAWSITAPANDGSCLFFLTNAASSAVAPTFSGFSVGANTGATLTTVGSAKFSINVWRANGTSGYSVYAHQ